MAPETEWSSFGQTSFHSCFLKLCMRRQIICPLKGWATVLFCTSCCTHVYVNLFLHVCSCTEPYNLCSYIAMTTATGSITDSMVWDDIPEKQHQPVNYSVSQVHIWVKKAVSHTFQPVCNWACANYAHIIFSCLSSNYSCNERKSPLCSKLCT